MDINNIELRLQDIDNRLKKIEQIERNRKIMGMIKLIITTLLVIAIIIYGIFLYQEFTSKIEPYQDIIGNFQNLTK